MRKLFTLITSLLVAATASATDYTDSLEVNINGSSTKTIATITINTNEDGTYNFSLNNFKLNENYPVGNIAIDNVQGTTVDGVTYLSVDRNIKITDGDDPNVTVWLGPMLPGGDVPVKMVAELRGDKLYTVIDIDMSAALGQVIKVTFGDGGYQIPNSDFENFYIANKKIYEPMHWHSFANAGGSLASFVNSTEHTFISTDVRPGSTGKSSVSVKSTSVLGIIANGTITTGRMIAGDMSATNTDNHAEINLSSTDKDTNGDPFHVEYNGQPDSLAVWVKFSQGKANASHPYATVSAVVTDGTYYQDPEDKTYTNKMAEARNTTIATTGGEWKRISIPFTYVDRSISPKAILVTISTNADAGQGSNGDEIIVDDLSLVYKAPKATAISIKGDAVSGFANGTTVTLSKSYENLSVDDITVTADLENAKVLKTVEQDGDNAIVTVKVTSNDLQSVETYIVSVPNTKATTTGITNVAPAKASNSAAEIYSVSGQRVSTMQPGKVYIVKKDGKTMKTVGF